MKIIYLIPVLFLAMSNITLSQKVNIKEQGNTHIQDPGFITVSYNNSTRELIFKNIGSVESYNAIYISGIKIPYFRIINKEGGIVSVNEVIRININDIKLPYGKFILTIGFKKYLLIYRN